MLDRTTAGEAFGLVQAENAFLSVVLVGLSVLPCGAQIHVSAATYGLNCGAEAGNATVALSTACDGKLYCEYTVDFNALGDPAPGCPKRFEVKWTCGTSTAMRVTALPAEAGLKSRASLSCPLEQRPTPLSIDVDQDRIDDRLEHSLLERYRPYLLFSVDDGDETFRPAAPWWYVERSELLANANEGSSPIQTQVVLSGTPNTVLFQSYGSHKSDIRRYPGISTFHLNPLEHVPDVSGDDPGRHGNPWPAPGSPHNIGLYGHVVPVNLTSPYGYDFYASDGGRPAGDVYYKIEYWQFFGYNSANKALNIGDHEGDWTSVQLVYDPRRRIITSVFHFAHGILMRFDITPQNNARTSTIAGPDGMIKEYKGLNYNFGSQTLDLVHLDLGTSPPRIVRNDAQIAKAQNNIVRFLQDPQSSEFTHPVVYVERGTHEFFPSEQWNFYGAPNHNGHGTHYLASTPPNLGEVEHPLGEDRAADLILHFNGYWGAYGKYNDPPPGPALHRNWQWVAGSLLRKQIKETLGF